MSKLKVFGIIVGAGVAAGLFAAAGFWAGDHVNTAGKFTEPLHSMFIASCIQQGIPQDLCFCAEQKLYTLEDRANAGENLFIEFMQALDQCAKEIPEDLD